ncbi:MAG: hypothetical protein WC331_10805 [Candidatus Omnitrophota bacterium]|jgi:hypothetical protein
MKNSMEILKPGKNTGVLIREPSVTDWIAGEATGLVVEDRMPKEGWGPYLGTGEKQHSVYMDSMACLTFSGVRLTAIQINYMIRAGLLEARIVSALNALGFLDEKGEFNASDRFTAKMSGTTRQGNYAVNVPDSIRHHGLLPEKDWPYPREQRTPAFDWDDYYAEIPEELKTKALEILKLFDFNWEWLSVNRQITIAQAKEWIKAAPFQILSPVCAPWDGSIIPACGRNVSHATVIYGATDVFEDFDTYDPFKKRLAADYPIPYALRIYVQPKKEIKPITIPLDMTFAKQQAGKILLNVEDHGSLWYVTADGRRAKIGNKPEEVEAFLQGVRDRKIPTTGINNADISKIPIVK